MTSSIATADFDAEIAKSDVRIVRCLELDNPGQDCPLCGNEGAVVEAQLYYVLDGEPIFDEGCKSSIAKRLVEIRRLGAESIQVEVQQ